MTKEWITKLEDDRWSEIIHSKYKEKIYLKVNGHNPRDLWNNTQSFLEFQKKKKGKKKKKFEKK